MGGAFIRVVACAFGLMKEVKCFADAPQGERLKGLFESRTHSRQYRRHEGMNAVSYATITASKTPGVAFVTAPTLALSAGLLSIELCTLPFRAAKT